MWTLMQLSRSLGLNLVLIKQTILISNLMRKVGETIVSHWWVILIFTIQWDTPAPPPKKKERKREQLIQSHIRNFLVNTCFPTLVNCQVTQISKHTCFSTYAFEIAGLFVTLTIWFYIPSFSNRIVVLKPYFFTYNILNGSLSSTSCVRINYANKHSVRQGIKLVRV